MKLRRPHAAERQPKAADMTRSAESGDDFDPAEWTKFERAVDDSLRGDPLDPEPAETPYGGAVALAESYYLLHPRQRERLVRFLSMEKMTRDVQTSLSKGHPEIPAAFQIFYPEDAIFPLQPEQWTKIKTRVDKIRTRGDEWGVQEVVAATRLFPDKRNELIGTLDEWLDRLKGMRKYPGSYVRACAQLSLLFPSVQGHIQEYMKENAEKINSKREFTSPSLSMRVSLEMVAGNIVLLSDGTFGFPKVQQTRTELPSRSQL